MVPLNSSILQTGLGEGYPVGWYGWEKLEGRNNDCKLSSSAMKELKVLFGHVKKNMNEPFETFAKVLGAFHNRGHWFIGAECSPLNEGGMHFSQVSARDPIFWRWHLYIENMVQRHRNRQLPK